MSVITDSLIRFSIADKSCIGTLANCNERNSHLCETESKAFWIV